MAESCPCVRIYGAHICIEASGRLWRLDHSLDLEDLWAAMSERELADERIPYWAELWPSSLALAELLELRQNEIREGYCLDLGCGLGFTALVGHALGANVFGCDYSGAALAAARRNASLNGMDASGPCWLAVDWRAPAFRPGVIRRIWAADILYEKRSFAPVLAFLDMVLASGGVAWVGEPGRAIFAGFAQMAEEGGWALQPVLKRETDPLHPGELPARVTIWQMERRA